jgi:hypothetical protein
VVGQPNCAVTVNVNNVVKVASHRAWKYAGNKKELEEKPQEVQKLDWIITPGNDELAPTGKEESLPNGGFAVLKFTSNKNGTCIIAGMKAEVIGTVGAESNPSKLETWATKEEQKIATVAWQHRWNGTAFVPFKTGLVLFSTAKEAAEYNGVFNIETAGKQGGAQQELAYFEK